jgi:hypothetical protein
VCARARRVKAGICRFFMTRLTFSLCPAVLSLVYFEARPKMLKGDIMGPCEPLVYICTYMKLESGAGKNATKDFLFSLTGA